MYGSPGCTGFFIRSDNQRLESFGNWINPTYNTLLETASHTTDPTLRNALFKQAEEILVETDAVLIPIYDYFVDIATKPYLQRTYGSVQPDFENWKLKEVPQPISLNLKY